MRFFVCVGYILMSAVVEKILGTRERNRNSRGKRAIGVPAIVHVVLLYQWHIVRSLSNIKITKYNMRINI